MSPPLLPLPNDAIAVRLVPKRFFLTPGEPPPPALFDPSSEEKKDAELRGWPVVVSVWDEQRTSIVQAQAFYPAGDRFVKATAGAIRDVEASRFVVLRDPILDDAKPGADGHCGVSGIGKRAGELKAAHKELMSRFADCWR